MMPTPSASASSCCVPFSVNCNLPRTATTNWSTRRTIYEMHTAPFQVIFDKAIADYREQIGVELDKHPFADQLQGCDSPDDILKLLEDKANAFKVYRDGNRKLFNWLSPVVQVIHTLSSVFGEAVSLIQMCYFSL